MKNYYENGSEARKVDLSKPDPYGYEKLFRGMEVEELVKRFNDEVGKTAWVTARGYCLTALFQELLSRGIDCSAVGDEQRFSLAKEVVLLKNKLVVKGSDSMVDGEVLGAKLHK